MFLTVNTSVFGNGFSRSYYGQKYQNCRLLPPQSGTVKPLLNVAIANFLVSTDLHLFVSFLHGYYCALFLVGRQ